VPLQ
jgi:hypothetical protein